MYIGSLTDKTSQLDIIYISDGGIAGIHRPETGKTILDKKIAISLGVHTKQLTLRLTGAYKHIVILQPVWQNPLWAKQKAARIFACMNIRLKTFIQERKSKKLYYPT